MAEANKDSNTMRSIIITAFAIPGAIALVIVATASYLWCTGSEVPKELGTLLATAVGYVFGVLPGFVKDYLNRRSDA